MRLLVTGGAGFIGTNFVYRAVKAGHDVVVLDALTYAGGKDNLEPLGDKVQLIVGDIYDNGAVSRAMNEVDTVVHFAAESHVTRSQMGDEGARLAYRTNFLGTRKVYNEAEIREVKQFVHVSTDEVYGSKPDGFFREEDKLSGDSQASSPYAKTKSMADDYVLGQSRITGFNAIVVRMTNNFGPWQFPEKALPRWITNLLLGEKIPLWGEGLQVRDWLYAPVCCSAIEFLMEHGTGGEVYNIAANNEPEITNRRAAEMVCGFMGKSPDEWIRHDPDPRPDHDFRYALDCSKIHGLGWKPPQEIEQQFEATVKWYYDHRDWWEPRKAEAERIYA